jgi:hypothetical protein
MPISDKSSKIKFLEKFHKILYKFLCQKWGRETPGRHQEGLPRHLPHRGRGPACGAPTWYEEAPPGFSLISSSLLFLSLPKTMTHLAHTQVLTILHFDFSISLLSPTFLLRFGAFVLRYVTPPLVQVEFLLVKYFLSILALYVAG